MLACWYYRRLGIPYLDESLRPAVRTAVSRHILKCAGCRDHLRRLQRTTGALRSAAAAAPAPPVPNPQLWSQIEARLSASPTPGRTVSYPICATGLTAAIACLGAYVFLSMGPTVDDSVSTGLPVPRSAVLSIGKLGSPSLLSPAPRSFTPAVSPSAAAHRSAKYPSNVIADLPTFSVLQAGIFDGGANVGSHPSAKRSSSPSLDGERRVPGRRFYTGTGRRTGTAVLGRGGQAALRHRRWGPAEIVVAERSSNRRSDSVLSAPTLRSGSPLVSDSWAGPAPSLQDTAVQVGDVSPAASDQVRRLASSVIAAGDSLAVDGGVTSRNNPDNQAAHPIPPANAAAPVSPAPDREWFYSEVHSLGPDGQAQTSSQVWGQVDPSGAPVFVQNHYSQGDDQ